tara:strand:- start:621 stop:821 length:201 start_codon:yes stop_codon:yes gene_type:complete
MIICSSVAGECMPPYKWPKTFNTQYDCLMFGYEESITKLKELGPKDVNKYGMFVKFYCSPSEQADT